MRTPGVLLQLYLTVGRLASRAGCGGGLGCGHGIALDRYPVGPFYGSQPGGYPCFAGGDGLAVASWVPQLM